MVTQRLYSLNIFECGPYWLLPKRFQKLLLFNPSNLLSAMLIFNWKTAVRIVCLNKGLKGRRNEKQLPGAQTSGDHSQKTLSTQASGKEVYIIYCVIFWRFSCERGVQVTRDRLARPCEKNVKGDLRFTQALACPVGIHYLKSASYITSNF